jgi:hypothetical protein
MIDNKVEEKDLIGAIKDYPLNIAQDMVDEQVKQGNKADIAVFCKDPRLSMRGRGFDWDKSKKGLEYWTEIIDNNNFEALYKCPAQPIEEFPLSINKPAFCIPDNSSNMKINTPKIQVPNDGIDYTILYLGNEYKMSDIFAQSKKIKELESDVERLSKPQNIDAIIAPYIKINDGLKQDLDNTNYWKDFHQKENERIKKYLSAVEIIMESYKKQ